jgi:hypothetical protein
MPSNNVRAAYLRRMLQRRIPAEEQRLKDQYSAKLLTKEQLERGLELLESERRRNDAALAELGARDR